MTMDKLLFKQFSFRLRAKMELYNVSKAFYVFFKNFASLQFDFDLFQDEQRVKVQCNSVGELNVNGYIKFLTEEIQKMEALPDAMQG